jgi:hypothetical protein
MRAQSAENTHYRHNIKFVPPLLTLCVPTRASLLHFEFPPEHCYTHFAFPTEHRRPWRCIHCTHRQNKKNHTPHTQTHTNTHKIQTHATYCVVNERLHRGTKAVAPYQLHKQQQKRKIHKTKDTNMNIRAIALPTASSICVYTGAPNAGALYSLYKQNNHINTHKQQIHKRT